MIDYNDPEIKKILTETAEISGLSEKEIIQLYEKVKDNIQYMRVTKGKHKGKVGIFYPDPFSNGNLFPYSKLLHFPNGDGLLCNGWSYLDFEHITKEEYERECERDECTTKS